ncbi:MAG: hypothetical protein NT003_03505 [Candidatus Magasanikbacteria bacterium]|nr:hypothetical protein [Candidatus Magasanikbacteria bacterium]
MAPRKKKRPNSTDDEALQLIHQCPLCETAYEPLEIKVIDEQDSKHLVFVTCRKCGHSVVALIMHQPNGVSSMGLITDTQPEDLVRLKNADTVNWDDCIAWHNFLKEDQLSRETFLN